MNSTIRSQFPLLDRVTYLNSASVCLMPLVAQEAGQRFKESVHRRRPDALEAWLEHVEVVRRSVAALVGADPSEIAFMGNTADGESFVANGIRFKPGQNIVIDDLDFPSGHITWREIAKRYGVEVREVQSVNYGTLHFQGLYELQASLNFTNEN